MTDTDDTRRERMATWLHARDAARGLTLEPWPTADHDAYRDDAADALAALDGRGRPPAMITCAARRCGMTITDTTGRPAPIHPSPFRPPVRDWTGFVAAAPFALVLLAAFVWGGLP